MIEANETTMSYDALGPLKDDTIEGNDFYGDPIMEEEAHDFCIRIYSNQNFSRKSSPRPITNTVDVIVAELDERKPTHNNHSRSRNSKFLESDTVDCHVQVNKDNLKGNAWQFATLPDTVTSKNKHTRTHRLAQHISCSDNDNENRQGKNYATRADTRSMRERQIHQSSRLRAPSSGKSDLAEFPQSSARLLAQKPIKLSHNAWGRPWLFIELPASLFLFRGKRGSFQAVRVWNLHPGLCIKLRMYRNLRELGRRPKTPEQTCHMISFLTLLELFQVNQSRLGNLARGRPWLLIEVPASLFLVRGNRGSFQAVRVWNLHPGLRIKLRLHQNLLWKQGRHPKTSRYQNRNHRAPKQVYIMETRKMNTDDNGQQPKSGAQPDNTGKNDRIT